MVEELSTIEMYQKNIADLEKEKYYLINRVKELTESVHELERQQCNCDCPKCV